MRRLTKKQIISVSITTFIMLFIFLNSAQPGDESSEVSGGILEVINNMLATFNVSITHTFLRKCAHFLGFFILGTSTLITTATFTKNLKAHIFKPLFVVLLTAVVDETIQLFPQGRSSQVSDVVLDFSGAFCGIMITWFIISKINKKRSQSKD